jgi:hypothetical protein
MPDPISDNLTPDEAAELHLERTGLPIHPATLRRWARQYEGLARRIGPRRLVFSRRRLEEICAGSALTDRASAA